MKIRIREVDLYMPYSSRNGIKKTTVMELEDWKKFEAFIRSREITHLPENKKVHTERWILSPGVLKKACKNNKSTTVKQAEIFLVSEDTVLQEMSETCFTDFYLYKKGYTIGANFGKNKPSFKACIINEDTLKMLNRWGMRLEKTQWMDVYSDDLVGRFGRQEEISVEQYGRIRSMIKSDDEEMKRLGINIMFSYSYPMNKDTFRLLSYQENTLDLEESGLTINEYISNAVFTRHLNDNDCNDKMELINKILKESGPSPIIKKELEMYIYETLGSEVTIDFK